jgi:hypothetical protein
VSFNRHRKIEQFGITETIFTPDDECSSKDKAAHDGGGR